MLVNKMLQVGLLLSLLVVALSALTVGIALLIQVGSFLLVDPIGRGAAMLVVGWLGIIVFHFWLRQRGVE